MPAKQIVALSHGAVARYAHSNSLPAHDSSLACKERQKLATSQQNQGKGIQDPLQVGLVDEVELNY